MNIVASGPQIDEGVALPTLDVPCAPSTLYALPACDPLLHPLISEGDELRREALIESLLVGHLGGIINGTLQRKMKKMPLSGVASASVDDIHATVLLRLLKRLRTLPDENTPIQNLAAYAATVALNAWDDFLREVFPQRTRLKNRIRYVLLRDGRFALWPGREQMLCGFAEWQGRPSGDAPDTDALRDRCEATTSLPDLLAALFHIVDTPVDLDAVVTAVAEVSHITDVMPGFGPVDPDSALAEPARAAGLAEDRQILGKLWGEILLLNVPQRVALLLNLRDAAGDAATPLFAMTGVATIEQIAAALEMPPHDFAVLWNDLPIEDTAIAHILGGTRQQVINLRSAARKRLTRRMRRF